jgi:small subunit ribosomal protein S13
MQEQDKNFRHLVRVVNTDLDGNKQIGMALRKIKGVSFMFSNAVCNVINMDKTRKTGYLTNEDAQKIEDVLKNPSKYNIPSWMYNRRRNYDDDTDKHLLTADLDFTKDNDIKMMKKIRSYKGPENKIQIQKEQRKS